MNKKEKIKKLKEEAEEHFSSICAVCFKKRKVMQFHHYKYIEGERTNKDFKNNDDYQLYILPKVIARPERFEYLCRSHHWKTTKATRTKESRDQLERLLLVVRCTQ